MGDDHLFLSYLEEEDDAADREAYSRMVEDAASLRSSVVLLNSLLPHLIRTHYFFEGRGSPYRTDPELLVRTLRL